MNISIVEEDWSPDCHGDRQSKETHTQYKRDHELLEPSCIALLWKPLCQPLHGPSRAMHGMLSWAPSKRVMSYPLARRLLPEVIPVGSKIGNATGVSESFFV